MYIYIYPSIQGFVVFSSDKAAPPEMPIVIDHVALKDILGPPLFEMEVSRMASGTCWAPQEPAGPLRNLLGPSTFLPRLSVCLQVSERLTLPGVALGLAWTPLGGEIMFVEASRMEGEGQLTLTGQLGDVMKESAHLAISWLRANARTYQLTNRESRAKVTAGKYGRNLMFHSSLNELIL